MTYNDKTKFKEILIADFFMVDSTYFFCWHLTDKHMPSRRKTYGTVTAKYEKMRYGILVNREVRIRVQSKIDDYGYVLRCLKNYGIGEYVGAEFWRRS